LIISAAAYAAGQILVGLFWYRVLEHLGLRLSRRQVLKAYALGTLGKYVPGKATVILIRAAMLPSAGVGTLRLGATCVFETTAMMAVGAVIAALTLVAAVPHLWWTWAAAAAIAVALLIALSPPVLRRLTRWTTKYDGNGNDTADADAEAEAEANQLQPANGRVKTTPIEQWPFVLPRSAWLILLGWLLYGLSFWCCGHALGFAAFTLQELCLYIGTAALATSAGFVVIFAPSGVGVRELVMIHVLGTGPGQAQAVIAALLIRIIWTGVEVIIAAVAMAGVPARRVRAIHAALTRRQSAD